MKVLSFGEILWDVYPDKKYIGGAPLNFSAHLAKHGEEVYMLSAIGRDALGEAAVKQLKEWNISTEYVSVLESRQTGICLISLDENSVPTYDLFENVAYDYISCDNLLNSFDVLYFGTLSLRSEYNYASLKKLLKTGKFKEIFVDVNIRPPFYTDDTIRFAVKNATILKISLEELPVIVKSLKIKEIKDLKKFAKKLAIKFKTLKCIIITLGSEGAYLFDCENNKEYLCGSEKVKVVSTVGAGDSFSAAFLHQYINESDIRFCLEYATRVAGFVVSEFDAVPNYNVKFFN